MNEIQNIVLGTRTEELEKILSPFIEEQFPSFVKTDYRKLVLFIKAYYEWCEKKGNAGYALNNLQAAYDLDENADEFYTHFKNTYLSGFLDTLATNTAGNKPNKNTLLKKIREFYGEKGTESAYRFFFRILYDSDLEFVYPGDNVLRASDGKWVETKSIKTSSSNGTALFSCKNGEIQQYSGTLVTATAFIDNVVQYSVNSLSVTEFFITDINGTFVPDLPLRIVKDDASYTEVAYSVIGGFNIVLPGTNYRIGDTVAVIEGDSGTGFSAKIEQVGLGGTIKKIGIIDSGINYGSDVVVTVFSDTGQQSAQVIGLRSAVTEYAGYFAGNRGKVSSDKFIQDGHYYQPFSYELKSALGLDQYYDVLKRIIHPAGMKVFGSVLIKGDIDNTISSSTQAVYYETPIVGNYTPYAFRTYNDLRSGMFLPNQVRGASLQVWISAYNIPGNSTDGVTANISIVGSDAGLDRDPLRTGYNLAMGVNRVYSLVTGHTFEHHPVYADVWSVPRLKFGAVNTHGSLVFRPVNNTESDFFYVTSTLTSTEKTRFRSFGYYSAGLSLSGLGLTASRSYFVVCKPRDGRTFGSLGSAATTNTGRPVISDDLGYHGIAFGYTGSTTTLKVVGWNSGANSTPRVIGEAGRTGEWKLVSQTYTLANGTSGPLAMYLNGTLIGVVTAERIAAGGHGKSLGIGQSNVEINNTFDGEVAEVLGYRGNVGDSDRQKIEGYLAHKYGLAESLPSSHPFRNTPPGASFSGGKWYGSTGDFYPNGYNPYIGSTSELGPDGTSASVGSLFRSTGLGYTYTFVDENGVTAHNPAGAPLGGITAWLANRESVLEPSDLKGLVLWLKPENIGVCGAVVNGASVDVWRDASPSQNHALPPTWDRWNSVAHITHTASTTTTWNRQVYDNTNPITKLSFVANGLCGGFTTGRVFHIGLNSISDVTNPGFADIDHSVYSLGLYNNGNSVTTDPASAMRRFYSRSQFEHPRAIIADAGTNMSGLDNAVVTIEYREPEVIFSVDGVVKDKVYTGYGKTFYFDSSFSLNVNDLSRTGHSVTITELSYKGNPVVPVFTSTAGAFDVRTYAGVTVDKLRPAISFSSASGATGVSFNGGVIYSPNTTVGTTTMYHAVGLGGNTYGAGSSAEKVLTGQHLYLSKPLQLSGEADVFMVFRPTQEGYGYGLGLFSANPNAYGITSGFDSVLFHRTYNAQDTNSSQQVSTVYTITPSGRLLYPGEQGVGLVGFRPGGGKPSNPRSFIAYDPHVSGVCFGTSVGEWVRDNQNRIDSYLNGDRATNFSPTTGLRISGLNLPTNEDYVIRSGLVNEVDASVSNPSAVVARTYRADNLVSPYLSWKRTYVNRLKPGVLSFGADGDGTFTVQDITEDFSTYSLTETANTISGAKARFNTRSRTYIVTPKSTGNFHLRSYGANTNWSDQLKSASWTFSGRIKRLDGENMPSTVGVYIYSHQYFNSPSVAENVSVALSGPDTNGWYTFTRTRTNTGTQTLNHPTYGITKCDLVGVYGLLGGVQYLVSDLQLTDALTHPGYASPSTEENYSTGQMLRADRPSGWIPTGELEEFSIEYVTDPWGRTAKAWIGTHSVGRSTSGSGSQDSGDGGFNSPNVAIDPTKTYRFSVWTRRKRVGNSNSGEFYFGVIPYGANDSVVPVTTANGAAFQSGGATNPYFFASTSDTVVVNNEWQLWVGHVYPTGTSPGSNHPQSGKYTTSSVADVGGSLTGVTATGNSAPTAAQDFVWGAGTSSAVIRSYLYYSSVDGERQEWMLPRIDLVDGTEPSIVDIITNNVNTIQTTGSSEQSLVLTDNVTIDSAQRGSLVFDGKNAAVIPQTNSRLPESGTVECWVRSDGSVGYYNMFLGKYVPYFSQIYDPATTKFAFYILDFYRKKTSTDNSGNPVFSTVASTIGTNHVYDPNKWYNMVYTYNVDPQAQTITVKLYVNGVLAKEETVVDAVGRSTEGDSFNWVLGDGREPAQFFNTSSPDGSRNITRWYPFKGAVSAFRNYDRVLSHTEISQNYNAIRGRYGL